MTIKTKRVYYELDPSDGCRLLIMKEPIWIDPAFDRKNFDSWVTELSPSPESLKSYQTGMINWDLFTEGFLKEMKNPISVASIRRFSVLNNSRDITLLCQEYEGEHCHSHLVKHLIDQVDTHCTVPSCKEQGLKIVEIPTHPGDYEGYDSIAVLCEYHYERFEEMYQPRWHEKLGDVQDLI
ncbi:MAG: DUF488 family protein [Candidatus Nitrosopolaris sp.]